MASGSIKECGICNEEYDEDERCPRNLPCSHCFCTACITQLIDKNDDKCPFCRRNFKAASAKDMAINTSFLDLLKYVKNLEGNVGDRGPVKSRAKMIKEMKIESEEENKRNSQSCHKAKQQIKQAIQNNSALKQRILENQLKFKEEILIKIKELEERYETNVRYIDHVNESLEKQLEVVDKHQETLDDVKRKLDRVTALQKVDAVIDEVEEASARLQPWLQTFHDMISRQDQIYQDLRKNIITAEEKLNVLAEVLNSSEEVIYVENHLKDLILTKETRTSDSGNPDYSAQWADYYRSMGMHREAEAIEQQAKCLKVGGPGGPTPNAALQKSEGAQPAAPGDGMGGEGPVRDYSQQWIEFYRAQGMQAEAEKIEAQVKASKKIGRWCGWWSSI